MKKILITLTIMFIGSNSMNAQQRTKPKLVVMMVIDQMRADYIGRYWGKFGDYGFKRIIKGGYNNKNANYNFFPTYTAAGHASISTGSIPALNGIVGNEWYDKNKNKLVYCTQDENVETVGSQSSKGLHSPSHLMTTTVGDELRLSTNFRSKVIGIALKDRAAILTAGHNATGVYWLDETNGRFISSTYYTKILPQWLTEFNERRLTEKYLSEKWQTSMPIDSYNDSSIADDNSYEGKFKGEQRPVFPHDIPSLSKDNLGLIKTIPNGNKLTFELAKAAIKGEALGSDDYPDLLNVSFSSPDYIGHQFGPRSIELADMYIKFDQELGQFLKYLDREIGKNNYVICISADHGASDNPNYLKDQKLPGGYAKAGLKEDLNILLKNQFGIAPVKLFYNQQVYLDEFLISQSKIDFNKVIDYIKKYILEQPYVSAVYSKEDLIISGNRSGAVPLLQNGFYFQRCGDVIVVFNSGYLDAYANTGTSHGSTYQYDTHVPLLWYGKGIRNETDFSEVKIIDIAPTLSAILDIESPSGNVGKVINNLLK